MLKRKSVLAGIGIALAMSMPLAMLTAVPAGAAAACESTQAPNHASSLQGFKVGCVIDVSATPTLNANHIDVHDGTNANWHRGAARTVTVTTAAASATITFAVGTLATADIRRPISGTGIGGTAFIRSVAPAACVITTCTSAVLSVASTAAAAVTATVEHTSSRVVTNASYTFGATTSVLTSATGTFVATDVNKSVSGGAFPSGARISAVTNATTVTVTPKAAAHATADDVITFGAVQYALDVAEPRHHLHRDLDPVNDERTPAPAGFASCAGSTLTITAAGGGTNVGDIELKVKFLDATGATVAGGPWKANTRPLATTLGLSATCPPVACVDQRGHRRGRCRRTARRLGDGVVGGVAEPEPGSRSTSDDCNKNTYEGFAVVGAWNNPGAFGGVVRCIATEPFAIAQISFTTSVVSFNGYVVPKTVAEVPAHQAVPHYDFTFPTLPTSLAVCPIVAGTTTTKTSVTLGFWSTTLTTAPFLPTGSGNPQSAPVRQIGPATGLFGQKVSLYNGTGDSDRRDLAPRRVHHHRQDDHADVQRLWSRLTPRSHEHELSPPKGVLRPRLRLRGAGQPAPLNRGPWSSVRSPVFARSQLRAGTSRSPSRALLGAVGRLRPAAPVGPTTTTDTTTTAKCPTPEILAGFSVTGATVTTPGAPSRTPRQGPGHGVHADLARVLGVREPAPGTASGRLPVSQLDVAIDENGQPSSQTIFYATDGTNGVGGRAGRSARSPAERREVDPRTPARADHRRVRRQDGADLHRSADLRVDDGRHHGHDGRPGGQTQRHVIGLRHAVGADHRRDRGHRRRRRTFARPLSAPSRLSRRLLASSRVPARAEHDVVHRRALAQVGDGSEELRIAPVPDARRPVVDLHRCRAPAVRAPQHRAAFTTTLHPSSTTHAMLGTMRVARAMRTPSPNTATSAGMARYTRNGSTSVM